VQEAANANREHICSLFFFPDFVCSCSIARAPHFDALERIRPPSGSHIVLNCLFEALVLPASSTPTILHLCLPNRRMGSARYPSPIKHVACLGVHLELNPLDRRRSLELFVACRPNAEHSSRADFRPAPLRFRVVVRTQGRSTARSAWNGLLVLSVSESRTALYGLSS
jgi:hypothetical protein